MAIGKVFHALVIQIFSSGSNSLRETCPYSEFFWSVFSLLWTEYGEILPVSPYSVQMRENTDQKYRLLRTLQTFTDEYGHFLRSDGHAVFLIHGQANPHSLPFFYVELVCRLSNNKFNYTPKQVHFLFISITIYD